MVLRNCFVVALVGLHALIGACGQVTTSAEPDATSEDATEGVEDAPLPECPGTGWAIVYVDHWLLKGPAVEAHLEDFALIVNTTDTELTHAGMELNLSWDGNLVAGLFPGRDTGVVKPRAAHGTVDPDLARIMTPLLPEPLYLSSNLLALDVRTPSQEEAAIEWTMTIEFAGLPGEVTGTMMVETSPAEDLEYVPLSARRVCATP